MAKTALATGGQCDPNNSGGPNRPMWPWPANFDPDPNDSDETDKVGPAAAEELNPW